MKEEPRNYVDEDVDMEENPIDDDGPPGVSSPPRRKTPIRKEHDVSHEVLFLTLKMFNFSFVW